MMKSTTNSNLLGLAKYLSNYKLKFLGIFIALSVSAASFLGIGIAIKHMINEGFSHERIEALNSTILLLVSVVAVLALASAARVYLIESTSERIILDIRRDIYNKLVHTTPYYFELNKISSIVSRLINDTALIQGSIATIFSFFLRNSVLIIGGLILLVLTNAHLALYTVALVPLVISPIIIFGRMVKKSSKDYQAGLANVSSHVDETLVGLKTVQAHNREELEKNKFQHTSTQLLQAALKRIQTKSYLVALSIFIVSTAVTVIIWLGGCMVLENAILPGDLVSFIFYAVVVAGAVGGMSEVVADINKASAGADRIAELLNVKVESRTGAASLTKFQSIQFKNVGFSYPLRPSVPVLQDLSFTIKKGEKIGVSGKSGCGKSTILQLLLGFYSPDRGSIEINGQNIANFNIKELRHIVGLVSQDPFIFSCSVYDNIAYGKAGASKEEVIEAAKLARIDDFIQSLPQAYDSFLGERGISLSAGQKQRIAIARAILKNPSILLLDEATSNLDHANEGLVQEALDQLMVGRTTLIISHRLNLLKNCDRVMFLEDGTLKVKSLAHG